MGREILNALLADDSVAAVHCVGRRAVSPDHPKLISHVVDFTALPSLPQVHEVYLALGSTIKVAGTQTAFRAVDYDSNLAVARAALAAGATRLGAVSAMGASSRSTLFYNRVKGETEEALAALAFDTVVFARPSFLAGDRVSLGQPLRPGEKLALRASQSLRFLIPSNYRSIDAVSVARSLVAAVQTTRGKRVLLSGEMQAT